MSEPLSPYREEKPLAELIAPDRRKAEARSHFASGLAVGICVCVLGAVAYVGYSRTMSDAREDARRQNVDLVGHDIEPSILGGPDAHEMFPPRGVAIVNVWLQGCSDCMPAFEAWKRGHDTYAFRGKARVVNVAYNGADPSWAGSYGVDENLVFDPGGKRVVSALGIGSFTTLVYENGRVVLIDRPDRPGFEKRVDDAVVAALARVQPGPLVQPIAKLDERAVSNVVMQHRAEVNKRCWLDGDTPTAYVNLEATIGPDGHVVDTRASGEPQIVTSCVDAVVRTWTFPPPGNAVHVSIPFRFTRE